MKEKITCIVGPIPPPIGGVSIFIKRYCKNLDFDGKKYSLITFSHYNILNKVIKLIKLIFYPSFSSFFINSSNINVILLLLLRPYKSKIIYYDHNFRFIEKLNKVQYLLYKKFLNKIDEFWYVEQKVLDYYEKHKLELRSKKKLINAFIAPNDLEYELSFFKKNNELNQFLEKHSPSMLLNASSIAFYKDIDLYGLDIAIELLNKLIKDFSSIGLIIAIGKINNNSYYKYINDLIKEYNLEKHVRIISLKDEIWPLFTKIDLMIRPTFTDGDALSIREALHFGSKVVASNCCKRPTGVIEFKNRNLQDFYFKVLNLIKSINCKII